MENEIVKGVFVGDFEDGMRSRASHVVCVLENPSPRDGALWIPLLLAAPVIYARPAQLDAVAFVIDAVQARGESVLIHCGAGIERSPLAVAWWLTRSGRAADLEESYRTLVAARPVVQDRRVWLQGAVPISSAAQAAGTARPGEVREPPPHSAAAAGKAAA